MRSARSSARWLSALVLAAVLGGGCRQGGPQVGQVPTLGGLVASCAWTEGTVELRRLESIYWEKVTIGTLLRSGDWVRTAAGARARLEFFVGGGLDVEPGTLVVVELSVQEQGPDEPMVAVESGQVHGRLAPSADGTAAASGLTVRTADGARVRLSASPSHKGAPAVVTLSAATGVTHVALAEGEAELLTGAGQRRALVGGQLLELVAGAARESHRRLGLPASLSPAVDARVALGAGERLALRWEPVEGARGYRVQVARDFSFRQLEHDAKVEQTSFEFACEGERAWRVAALDGLGGVGEFGFARRVFCKPE